jgi:serine/threonine-protein kinase
MSPEQARGEAVGPGADIYSVGVMAYELFSGRLPFIYDTIPRLLIAHQNEPPVPPSRHLRAGDWPIPQDIEALIVQSLQKNPAQRPAHIGELLDVFEQHASRASGLSSKIIPQVVLQESGALDEDDDWCEVTVDASAEETSATLYSQAPYSQAPYSQAPYSQAPYSQTPYSQAADAADLSGAADAPGATDTLAVGGSPPAPSAASAPNAFPAPTAPTAPPDPTGRAPHGLSDAPSGAPPPPAATASPSAGAAPGAGAVASVATEERGANRREWYWDQAFPGGGGGLTSPAG